MSVKESRSELLTGRRTVCGLSEIADGNKTAAARSEKCGVESIIPAGYRCNRSTNDLAGSTSAVHWLPSDRQTMALLKFHRQQLLI